jgi:signal transduction histidine kinase
VIGEPLAQAVGDLALSCAGLVIAVTLLLARPRTRVRMAVAVLAAIAAVGFNLAMPVALGAPRWPFVLASVVLSGFVAPVAGIFALRSRICRTATVRRRTQARLLLPVLLVTVGTAAALAVLSAALWALGTPGLTLAGTGAAPLAPLYWFSRLAAVGVAGTVLLVAAGPGRWNAERTVGRGLAAVIVLVLAGGGFVLVRAVAGAPGPGATLPVVVATVLVALAFGPLTTGAQRLVGWLMYGRRPTPYRVLAEVAALSRTVSPGGGTDLAGAAEAIGRGLGARICELTVLRPGLRERTYRWTSDDAGAVGSGDAGWAEHDRVGMPIRQGDERIGTISVDRAALAGLHDERRTLLRDVADSLGAILQATRAGIELERQLRAALAHAEEIAVSRRRGVAEMDGERRRIERDLHDGAQHHLVSLRLSLGLVEHELASGQPGRARARLDQLGGQLATAEAVLEQTASGVSSAVLAERGLAAALTADLSGAHPPVVLDLDERRFAPEVEAAVYFCCLEAVNNARKHAGDAPVAVRLHADGGVLRFTVRDDGPGFQPAAINGSPGRGLGNLETRIRSVGGELTVDSAQGSGTTVAGTVPVAAPPRPPVPAGAPSPARPPRRMRPPAQVEPAVEHAVEHERRAQLAGWRAEADQVAEALRSGALRLPAVERAAAERLLGSAGPDPAARLGLPAGAGAAAVREACRRELAGWRRVAAHPGSTSAVRRAADTLARACEDLLAAAPD